MLFEKKFIKLKEGQDLDDYINELKIGSIYYMNNDDGSYTEYTLVPIKKEYVGQLFDDTKCQILKRVMSVYTPTIKFIDLGLPSGTKWAICNVGASKPSEAGLYFQFGDSQGYTADGQKKFANNWTDYKWNPSSDGKTFTKYNTAEQVLDLEDDGAHSYMRGDWHMPTISQIQELINNTTATRTTLDNVTGTTFTSKTDTSKSIFIPYAGYIVNATLTNFNSKGYIWSSMVSNYRASGRILYLQQDTDPITEKFSKFNGLPIRGVIG